MKVKSESEVTQSCPTPSDPMDCSLPGSSVHGICQARVLEWGAICVLLCQLLPVSLCYDRALGRDARLGERGDPKLLIQPLTHPDSEEGGLWAGIAEGHLLLLLSFSCSESCLTFCNPVDCRTQDFPVLHYLLEFAQIHVHQVDDAI